MINFFANIFGYVLNWIYVFVQNYGLAIILFSILIKVVMLPLSINQQKTLKKNEKIQKKLKILQIKYKGNQEKLTQETMELYKREKVSPFSGCLSVILQLILLLSMFYLVRSPLTFMKKVDASVIDEQKTKIQKEYGDNSLSKNYPEISIIKYAKNNPENKDISINMDFLGLDLSKIPQENYSDFKVYIIPALYVISSIISIKISTTSNKKSKENPESKELTNEQDKKEMDQEEMAEQMNKNMSLLMPILSVSISLVAPLGLALYWLVNNIIMIVERLILNKIFSKEEEKDA